MHHIEMPAEPTTTNTTTATQDTKYTVFYLVFWTSTSLDAFWVAAYLSIFSPAQQHIVHLDALHDIQHGTLKQ